MTKMSFNPKREARPSQTMSNSFAGFEPANTFQSQTGSQALSDLIALALDDICQRGFNPKREARPSQTVAGRALPRRRAQGFNPKREARPSQTPAHQTTRFQTIRVSIPNGKPGPLRPSLTLFFAAVVYSFNPKREARPSQTMPVRSTMTDLICFNPKREARPSQTRPLVNGIMID